MADKSSESQDTVQSDQVAASWEATFADARREARAGRRPRRKAATQTDEASDEIKALNEVADKLMEPKYWRGLVRAPADFMLMRTGHRHWNLSADETDTLATTGSLTAKAFLPSMDPKYLCLLLFLSNLSFIYGTRLVEELRLAKEEALERQERREPKP